jgi:hypothetical protein
MLSHAIEHIVTYRKSLSKLMMDPGNKSLFFIGTDSLLSFAGGTARWAALKVMGEGGG